jgi:hypothetical protein
VNLHKKESQFPTVVVASKEFGRCVNNCRAFCDDPVQTLLKEDAMVGWFPKYWSHPERVSAGCAAPPKHQHLNCMCPPPQRT